MRELQLIRAGRLAWADRPEPQPADPGDAIVRPLIAGRCDGDTVPIDRPVSHAMQVGNQARRGSIRSSACTRVACRSRVCPRSVTNASPRSLPSVRTFASCRSVYRVVVPWAVSCGTLLDPCLRGFTSKCATTTTRAHSRRVRVRPGERPVGRHDRRCLPSALTPTTCWSRFRPVFPAQRIASASDNLADAWRTVVPPLSARPRRESC